MAVLNRTPAPCSSVSSPKRRVPIDIVADAYNVTVGDPVIRTAHDAAEYILDALEAADFAIVEKTEVTL